MEDMNKGTEGQVSDTPKQSTEVQPQEAAAPVQSEQEKEGAQKQEEEKEPDVYIDKDGNLNFSDDILGIEPDKKEEKPVATEEPEQKGEAEKPQLFKVKVDGEDVEVTLDELLNGYSRRADYTKKTMAVAQERKSLEALKADIDEQMRSLEMQNRYGIQITPEIQKQISAQADNILRNQYGAEDDMSPQYQDIRTMLINQLTSKHSETVKATQRMAKTEQYLRISEPNFDKINNLAMQIAATEMPAYKFEKLRQAETLGDPAPLLEVFDIARERFYGAAKPAATTAPAQNPAAALPQSVTIPPVQTQKITPEPPKTESGAGTARIEQPRATFDAKGFSKMTRVEQEKFLLSQGLVD